MEQKNYSELLKISSKSPRILTMGKNYSVVLEQIINNEEIKIIGGRLWET